jgi:hypothetical protein
VLAYTIENIVKSCDLVPENLGKKLDRIQVVLITAVSLYFAGYVVITVTFGNTESIRQIMISFNVVNCCFILVTLCIYVCTIMMLRNAIDQSISF